MAKEKRWQDGSDFIQKEESDLPVNQIDTDKVSEATEMKKTAEGICQADPSNGDCTMISIHEDDQLWRLDPKRFSIQTTLEVPTQRGEIMVKEIEDAAIEVIKGAQRNAFPEEYLTPQPCFHEENQMRCDGCLKYAEFQPQDARFSIMLPRKNCVTKLILKHHENDNHAVVTNQMLVALSTCFWNISGREEIREWENECNECHRRKAKPAKQIMDPPPQIRLRFFLRSSAQTNVDCGEP